jgi:porin
MRRAPQTPTRPRLRPERRAAAEAAPRANRLSRIDGVRWVLLIAGVLDLLAMAHSAAGQEGFQPESVQLRRWLNGPTATGEWGGARDALREKGVDITASFTTDLAGNINGGTRSGSTYAGSLSAGAGLDLEKLACIPGVSFTAGGFWLSGRSLSQADVGNVFETQQVWGPGSLYLGQLNLAFSAPGNTVVVEAGRLFAADVFATSPVFGYYTGGGVNGNLNSIPLNIFFPGAPVAAWAARATVQPWPDLRVTGALYHSDPNAADPDRHGTDFDFTPAQGVLTLAQATYQHHQTRREGGLPGSISVGAYYDSSRFADLNRPSERSRGNYGGYLIVDQMVYRGDWPDYTGPPHLRAGVGYAERAKHPYHPQAAASADRPDGLTVWGGIYAAPEESVNTQVLQLAGGLLFQGMFPGRGCDVTALGIVSGTFSGQLSSQGTETVVEINHRFQVCPWWYVTPAAQYINRPSGRSAVDDAVVLVLETGIDF